MKSDENYIESRFGKSSPFVVPEGYFDHLADNIIGNVPECAAGADESRRRPVQTVWLHYRRYVAIAACIALLAGLGAAVVALPGDDGKTGNNNNVAASHVDRQQQDASDDDAEIDYTMLDNETIYSLVASN